ncbi:unnamed protein product [Prunus armeniaca]
MIHQFLISVNFFNTVNSILAGLGNTKLTEPHSLQVSEIKLQSKPQSSQVPETPSPSEQHSLQVSGDH